MLRKWFSLIISTETINTKCGKFLPLWLLDVKCVLCFPRQYLKQTSCQCNVGQCEHRDINCLALSTPRGERQQFCKSKQRVGRQSGVITIYNIYYVEWIQYTQYTARSEVRHTMRNSVLRCNQSSRLGFLPVAGGRKVSCENMVM